MRNNCFENSSLCGIQSNSLICNEEKPVVFLQCVGRWMWSITLKFNTCIHSFNCVFVRCHKRGLQEITLQSLFSPSTTWAQGLNSGHQI